MGCLFGPTAADKYISKIVLRCLYFLMGDYVLRSAVDDDVVIVVVVVVVVVVVDIIVVIIVVDVVLAMKCF